MHRFRYSLNSSTIKPAPILEKIRIAAAVGYEAIELWHDDIDLHLAGGGTIDEVRSAVEDCGLEVPTTIFLKGWWDAEAPDYSDSMEEIRRRLDQAAAVGAPFSVASPPPWAEVDYDATARQYHDLIELGLSRGVRPAFEYLGFAGEVNSIAKALRVIEEAGHPQAAIVIDPFHDFRGGAGHDDIARLTADQIAVSHFNDAPASPPRNEQHDPDRVMPGEGIVDLQKYLALLAGTGYDRFLSLELFREDLWARDPEEVAREGLQKMKMVCEAAG